MGNDARFLPEIYQVVVRQLSVQYFNSSQGLQVNMLSQVDISEVAPPQETDELVISQLLSFTFSLIPHDCTSSRVPVLFFLASSSTSIIVEFRRHINTILVQLCWEKGKDAVTSTYSEN